MKKLTLTIAIVLAMAMTSFADPNGDGLFQRGASPERQGLYNTRTNPSMPLLPSHGSSDNQDADELPMGSGIEVLIALGGTYLVAKKRKDK